MKTKLSALSFILIVIVAIAALGQKTDQLKVHPDPVPVYPNNYKVMIENDRVRVMDFKLRKGDAEEFHSHPAHVLYVLEGFKVMFKFPDGRTAIRETKKGDVLFSEAVTHSPTNIGDTDAHGILIELKSGGKAAQNMDAEDLLTAVTFINGLAGKEDELKNELLKTTAPTRGEAGNLRYDLYQSTVEPNKFMRYEIWRSPLDLELHKQTPWLRESFETRKRQGWTTNITTWKRVRDW
jgi:quinol monooxygenase YgiN/quercetin dioxygenase-like cupin family protein